MNYIAVDDAEHATILAALRYYQANGQGDPNNRSVVIHEIATNCDKVMSSLDDDGIDALCERINVQPGPEWGPNVLIADDAWQPTGPDPVSDGSRPADTRLLARMNINGTPMHLEAYQVKEAEKGGYYSGGEQIAADEHFDDDVGTLQSMQDATFQTTELRGRTFILVATPHGS